MIFTDSTFQTGATVQGDVSSFFLYFFPFFEWSEWPEKWKFLWLGPCFMFVKEFVIY